MRYLVFALALLGATATSARAQDAIPDLKGTWSGKGKSIVFGTNPHHPGSQTPADPPRVRDIEATYVVDGQEGRLAWGRSWSTAANTQEPFAWAIANDNKTIVGADMDGYFRITLISPDACDRRHLPRDESREPVDLSRLPRERRRTQAAAASAQRCGWPIGKAPARFSPGP